MAAEPVNAELKFLANLDEPLVYIPSKGGGDETAHVGNFSLSNVTIHDGRRDKMASSLDVEGFRLVRQKTSVRDFHDRAQIESIYHDEVKTMLTEATGAARIEVFDDTLRSNSLERQRQKAIREPASIVHNDYTASSGLKRLRDHFSDDPDGAETLLERRFAIINVWRSITGPVHNHHLAVCDANTVGRNDLVDVERRAEERIGEIQLALHNPQQRWYYFPEMQMDEVLLVKTFDSETQGLARFTLHTSFEDPGAPMDAPPRESIETRCLVFFQ